MKLPELPEGLEWRSLERGWTIRQGREEVAWYWLPGEGRTFKEEHECVSAPLGVFDEEGFHRQPAQTEEEAINLIVAFALMGITKEK